MHIDLTRRNVSTKREKNLEARLYEHNSYSFYCSQYFAASIVTHIQRAVISSLVCL